MEMHENGFMPLDLIPEEIIEQCDLLKIACNGKAHFEVRKSMPGDSYCCGM